MDKNMLCNHLKLLDKMYDMYDEDVRMIGEIVDKPNAYHTRLKWGDYTAM